MTAAEPTGGAPKLQSAKHSNRNLPVAGYVVAQGKRRGHASGMFTQRSKSPKWSRRRNEGRPRRNLPGAGYEWTSGVGCADRRHERSESRRHHLLCSCPIFDAVSNRRDEIASKGLTINGNRAVQRLGNALDFWMATSKISKWR